MHKRVLGAVALLGLAGALGLTGAAPAGAHTMPAPAVSVTLTSADLRRALSPMPRLRFGRLKACVRAIRVNDRDRYQSVLGFGAAMTDSSAWLIWDELPARRRTSVMRDLFASSGIELN